MSGVGLRTGSRVFAVAEAEAKAVEAGALTEAVTKPRLAALVIALWNEANFGVVRAWREA